MLGGIATWERETIAERTKDAMTHKKKKGHWVGKVPFGFSIKDNRLEENPEEIKTIQKAKRMKRAGKSIRDIAESLKLRKSLVHKVVNVNLRTLKAQYSGDLA